MNIFIREYKTQDAEDAAEIWNQVVRDGVAFPQEKELEEKVARLGELNALLDMDKKDRVMIDEEPEEGEIEPERRQAAWVR